MPYTRPLSSSEIDSLSEYGHLQTVTSKKLAAIVVASKGVRISKDRKVSQAYDRELLRQRSMDSKIDVLNLKDPTTLHNLARNLDALSPDKDISHLPAEYGMEVLWTEFEYKWEQYIRELKHDDIARVGKHLENASHHMGLAGIPLGSLGIEIEHAFRATDNSKIDLKSMHNRLSPEALKRAPIREKVAALSMDARARTWVAGTISLQDLQKTTDHLSSLGVDIEILKGVSKETRVLAAEALRGITHMAEQQNENARRGAVTDRFNRMNGSCHTLMQLGRELKKPGLYELGRIGSQLTNIAFRFGELTGNFGLTKVVGLAAINPALGLVAGVVGLVSGLFSSSDKESETIATVLLKEIDSLRDEIRKGFDRTWKNQATILEAINDLYDYTAGVRELLRRGLESGREERSQMRNHQIQQSVSTLDEIRIRIEGLENKDITVRRTEAVNYLDDVYKKWFSQSQKPEYTRLEPWKSFSNHMVVQDPTSSIQWLAQKARYYDKKGMPHDIRINDLVNFRIFNPSVSALEGLMAHRTLLPPTSVLAAVKECRRLAWNQAHFCTYLSTAQTVYDKLWNDYIGNIDNAQKHIERRFLELKSKGENRVMTLAEMFHPDLGSNAAFQQLLEKNDSLFQMARRFCLVSASLHKEWLGMKRSRDILAQKVDLRERWANLPQQGCYATCSTGRDVLALHKIGAKLIIKRYDPTKNTWSEFLSIDHDITPSTANTSMTVQPRRGRQVLFIALEPVKHRIQLVSCDLATKKWQVEKQSAPIELSDKQFLRSDNETFIPEPGFNNDYYRTEPSKPWLRNFPLFTVANFVDTTHDLADGARLFVAVKNGRVQLSYAREKGEVVRLPMGPEISSIPRTLYKVKKKDVSWYQSFSYVCAKSAIIGHNGTEKLLVAHLKPVRGKNRFVFSLYDIQRKQWETVSATIPCVQDGDKEPYKLDLNVFTHKDTSHVALSYWTRSRGDDRRFVQVPLESPLNLSRLVKETVVKLKEPVVMGNFGKWLGRVGAATAIPTRAQEQAVVVDGLLKAAEQLVLHTLDGKPSAEDRKALNVTLEAIQLARQSTSGGRVSALADIAKLLSRTKALGGSSTFLDGLVDYLRKVGKPRQSKL